MFELSSNCGLTLNYVCFNSRVRLQHENTFISARDLYSIKFIRLFCDVLKEKQDEFQICINILSGHFFLCEVG